MRRALQNLALAALPLTFLLLATEGVLRWTGAARECPNRFNRTDHWVCDPVLHFRLDPDFELAGERALNAAGFRGREFDTGPPEAFRVVALGDSCTFGLLERHTWSFVSQPYPTRLQRLADRRAGEGALDVLNAGIPGYNSFQGLMLLRSSLRDTNPDLVTVRFGWNDHFLSPVAPGTFSEPEARWLLGIQDVALRTELYRFVRRLGLEWRAFRAGPAPAKLHYPREWRPTIPPDEYAQNLGRIVDVARTRGAEVWLLTAPHNPAPNAETRELIARRNRLEYSDLIRIHEEYNEIVRRVGAERRVPVVDMAAIYWRRRDEPTFLPTDAVHPAQGGHNLEAEVLYSALVRRGVVPDSAD